MIIPEGFFDLAITNPGNNGIYFPYDGETGFARADDFEFEGGFTYTFTVSSYGVELVVEPTPPEAVHLPGDINCDSVVNMQDAVITMRIAMDLIDETDLDITAADIDEDGFISFDDAVRIMRIALSLN